METFDLIRQWAKERDLYFLGDIKTQTLKLYEEVGELSQATLKQNEEGVKDAIGDIIVVLTNLAHMHGLRVEDCIDYAYNEIKNRKGSIKNNTFIKDDIQ
jgi:NTP pyrophosphatase (non-canonical NTP hydrolase)